MGPPLPFPTETTIGHHPDWATKLQDLLAEHSFKLGAVASGIGVKQETVMAEALRQRIRVPLSAEMAMRLGRQKLKTIQSELCMGISKKRVARIHAVGAWTIRLIELATLEIGDARKNAIANKMRSLHRQRVLDYIGSAPNASRNGLRKSAAGTYQYMRAKDRKWFEKTIPERPRGRDGSPRGSRFDRGQLDSELAEKIINTVRELKSTSHRPVRITKFGVLRRAECLKYYHFSTDLPKTQSVLNENVETMADYRVRRIRWAIAEIARSGQAMIGETLRRKAGLSTTLLHEYKQLALQTAQQLRVSVGSHSFFARDI
jgi:hypothetical protein